MKKVAIVTGASRGIGAATARLLAKEGYAVCVNYATGKKEALDVVNSIQQQGGTALALQADLSKESDIIEMFNTVKNELGPVSALVNNAGLTGARCPVEEITMEQLNSVFATNVFGTFLCCREAIKQMKDFMRGSIVNVSSEAARFGGNRLAHYAASKAAINTLTIGFAREIAQYNIRVNTISPGVIDTEMHAKSPPERIAALKSMVPMGRMGTAHEVAEAIVWLLSDKASYLSGTIVPVAGGR